MPVLFNFVRKKKERERGEGEERKTEEREKERERERERNFKSVIILRNQLLGKRAKRDTWRRGYLENLALQISFYSTLKKGEKARGKRKGTKRW